MSGAAVLSLWAIFSTKSLDIENYLALLKSAIPGRLRPLGVIHDVIMSAWRNLGFTFVLFLGGLSNISREVLDAADVDGAQGFRRLWSVTIPLLSPQILFAAVTGVIGAVQVFEEPFIMTRGGPGNASRTAVMVLYEAAFKNIEYGYGSALRCAVPVSWVQLVQMWMSRRWFYQ